MATDEYDPENFDWGEDAPGISEESLGPDIWEHVVIAALQAHEEKFGWRYLRKSERKEGAGRLFKYKYFMPEDKRPFFEENYPGYTFIWDGALLHHDHPAAHLAAELGEIEMTEALIMDDQPWIDLFGNPGRNAKYKRKCVTLYQYRTAKDYLRFQNVGPNAFEFDFEKLIDPEGVLGKIDHITLSHALYYLSMEQIAQLVHVRRTRRVHALVHRHSQTYGKLNAGEQEYWVDHDGVVTQRNVATGEYYRHPTLEPLFHQFSARTKAGGVAWTVRHAGADAFIIEFVGCPNHVCEDFKRIDVLKRESWEEYTYSNISVQKFLHWTWMSASTAEGRVAIEDLDLFEKLRRYVAGKPRTPRLKTETMHLARRLCNKLDVISIHGGGAHVIPVASMKDYVEVATYVDVQSEFNIALSFHKENAQIVSALNAYYEKATIPRDFTAVTGAAIVSARTISDAASEVLERIRESQSVRLSDTGSGQPDPILVDSLYNAGIDARQDQRASWWG